MTKRKQKGSSKPRLDPGGTPEITRPSQKADYEKSERELSGGEKSYEQDLAKVALDAAEAWEQISAGDQFDKPLSERLGVSLNSLDNMAIGVQLTDDEIHPTKVIEQSNLEDLVESESRLRALLIKAHEKGQALSQENLRDWWGAVHLVCLCYAREIARNRSSSPLGNLPIIMARMAGDFSCGIIPEYVASVARRGNPPAGYWEKRDIGIAVAYHKACAEGITHNGQLIRVFDRHPTQTIVSAFGVDKSTVRSWCRKYSPSFLGVNDITAEVLEGLLRKAGNRYQQAGRSRSAVRARAKARRKS